MFDLPEPFGPTIAEIEESKSSFSLFAKDLNPPISKDFKRIFVFYHTT
jgi:hypothetical protein